MFILVGHLKRWGHTGKENPDGRAQEKERPLGRKGPTPSLAEALVNALTTRSSRSPAGMGDATHKHFITRFATHGHPQYLTDIMNRKMVMIFQGLRGTELGERVRGGQRRDTQSFALKPPGLMSARNRLEWRGQSMEIYDESKHVA
jgi:hypothetical protein